VQKVALDIGVASAGRTYGYGLVSYGSKSAGALFWGVDPEREKAAFDLPRHMETGAYLAAAPGRGVVLGRKLARSLNAQTGSELVVVVQAADGSLGNELFTVTGILKAAGEAIDRSAAILHMADFRELFVLPEGLHEVAANSRGRLPIETMAGTFEERAPGCEVKTWRDLMPAVSDIINLFDAFMVIFSAIFFLAGGLGVMNTMLMATYERIREFGILKALGTTPWRIVRDVVVEVLVLAAAATLLGTIAGVAGSCYLAEVGIDTTAFAGQTSVGGVAFDPIWRASLSGADVLGTVGVMWVVCALAAIYPGTKAARLDPVRAMQHV
ncbi:ABC transporter permease, partial [Thermodesulfobacteriota bacterium]